MLPLEVGDILAGVGVDGMKFRPLGECSHKPGRIGTVRNTDFDDYERFKRSHRMADDSVPMPPHAAIVLQPILLAEFKLRKSIGI